MPSASWRTTSRILAWVFRPTSPYTTCTPASSSMRARSMFACSSKRALSSTSATTCLPCSAAVDERARRCRLSAPAVRYSVCLIASTSGSRAAWCDERLDRRRERVVRVVHEHVAAAQDAEAGRACCSSRRRAPAGSAASTARPSARAGRARTASHSPARSSGPSTTYDVGVGELELAAQQRRAPRRSSWCRPRAARPRRTSCAGAAPSPSPRAGPRPRRRARSRRRG